MSSSRRREEMAAGVEESPERASRILPSLLTKSTRIFGARDGPNPVANFSLAQ